jgi:hypothetical protein
MPERSRKAATVAMTASQQSRSTGERGSGPSRQTHGALFLIAR